MIGDEKEVYFDKYCKTCVHNDERDELGLFVEVCDDCQGTPMNTDSHKPVNYKEVRK